MAHALQTLCILLSGDATRIATACEATMAELAPALIASATSKVSSVRECGEEALSLIADAVVSAA